MNTVVDVTFTFLSLTLISQRNTNKALAFSLKFDFYVLLEKKKFFFLAIIAT